MNDNADGLPGVFSIQNVARMSLVYNKYPGEWHGPGSISNVMRDLNKIYLPYENFRITHFVDGVVYLDKILKAGFKKPALWLTEQMKKNTDELDEEKAQLITKFPSIKGLRDMNEKILILGGGLPIEIQEEIVGAIGVGGAPGAHLDEACALAGVQAIGGEMK